MNHITVVVCTYNRADSLRDALDSLIVMNTGNLLSYEVLVVNNNSKDQTSKVVSIVAEQTRVPVREVIETQAGVVYARNLGVQEANGEWIAFFDDDQLADPNWLVELIQAAQTYHCRCVGGAVTLKLPPGETRELSPICRMLLGESVGLSQPQAYTPRVTPGAGNLMIHKSVFDEIGLFDEAYNKRGEDTDLFLRMYAANIQAWFTPKAIIQHVIPTDRLTSSYLLKLSTIMSQGMAEDERKAVGNWRFPLYWTARFGHAALVVVPRYFWSILTKNREHQLGLRCRLMITKGYLQDGFPLLFSLS